MSKEEEQLYPEIAVWLENYLKGNYKGYEIEVTYETARQYLDTVLRKRGIDCQEALSVKIKVDIVGILKKKNKYELVFVEVKDTDLTLKDLGQLWGYTKLVNPIESFLITSKNFGSLNYIFKVLKREDVLKYGIKRNNFMKIAQWDKERKMINYSTTIPK